MSSLETISPNKPHDELVGLRGNATVSNDPKILESYSRNESFAKPQPQAIILWPKSTPDARVIVET